VQCRLNVCVCVCMCPDLVYCSISFNTIVQHSQPLEQTNFVAVAGVTAAQTVFTMLPEMLTHLVQSLIITKT